MKSRCVIHLLDASDLERSIDDPALAALVHDGWSVMSNLVVETPQGNRVALLLAPPIKKQKDNIVFKIAVSSIVAVLIQSAAIAWILL